MKIRIEMVERRKNNSIRNNVRSEVLFYAKNFNQFLILV